MRAPIISATACLTQRGPRTSPYPMEASLADRTDEENEEDDDDIVGERSGPDEPPAPPPPPRRPDEAVEEANSSAESMSVLSPATFSVVLLLLLPETAFARGMRVLLETLAVLVLSLKDLALSSSSFFNRGPT